MAEQKESSVLFSLKELMSLEEDRIKQEEDARKRAEDAAMQARQAEERRKQEEENARLREAEERRRQEEQRSREEQARVDAIKQAEVERARLEAENRARMETLARQQAHEKEIAALSQDKSKKNLRLIVGLTIGALFIVAGGAGAFIYNQKQKEAALTAQLNDLNTQLDANNKKMSDLNADLASAKDPQKQAEIEAKIAALQAQNQDLATKISSSKSGSKPAVGTGGGQVTAPVHKIQCHQLDGTKVASCAPGDSLCTCD